VAPGGCAADPGQSRTTTRRNPTPDRILVTRVGTAGSPEIELHPDVVALDGEEARIWGRAWSQRVLNSSVGEQAVFDGYATQSDLDRFSRA
jgi:hypothetical protein